MNDHNDRGLSEVIGFVLIIGLLTIVLSLYITYVVPTIGRDNEIQHMNYIKDQFADFKITTDALWLNNATGVTLARSINLGSKAKTAESTSTFFPILQPIGSGGTLSVNISKDNPRLNIIANYKKKVMTTESGIVFDKKLANTNEVISVNSSPNHIYLKFKKVLDGDGTDHKKAFNLLLNDNAGQKWEFAIYPSKTGADLFNTNYNSNIKNFNESLNNSAIITQNLSYTGYGGGNPVGNLQDWLSLDMMDIFDDLRIMKDIQYPLHIKRNNTQNEIYLYVDTGQLEGSSYPLRDYNPDNEICDNTNGCRLSQLNYQSQNNYWIQQEYYYQNGGLFLKQNDGSVVKIVPSITITSREYSGQNNIYYPYVFIPIITLSPDMTTNQQIGGSSPVQIISTLISTMHIPLPHGEPNADKVTIQITNLDKDNANLWKSTFNTINQTMSQNENVNVNWINVTGTDSSASLIIDPKSFDSASPGVEMDIVFIKLKVGLQSVASPIS